MDGKESRGSKLKGGGMDGAKALQALNVYSSDYGMCLAQKLIDGKTNEIPAAQELLKLMEPEGTIVTADAMNCQKDTASTIVGRKGDYVLALKGNQPLFYEEVKGFFDEGKREGIRKSGKGYKKNLEKEHGGLAQREYYITGDVAEEECRYYICSIGEGIDEFERAARGHWGVEVNLHWQLDFTFRDDKNTSMARTGANNLQIMEVLWKKRR